MTFRIEVKSDKPLEPGTYHAELRSVEEKETQYGERLFWLFNVPEHNAEVAGFTSLSSSNQAFATLWSSALNPDISRQRSWGPDDVVGRECVLDLSIVDDSKGRKKNKILQVRPAQKDS